MEKYSLKPEQFPMQSFREFVVGFVDDLAIFSSKNHPMPEEIHFLCIEAVFYPLESAGWLVKIEVSTFMNPEFFFLGLKWNLREKSSIVQNDRVDAILNHRPPRSVPELASRLATLQYYQNWSERSASAAHGCCYKRSGHSTWHYFSSSLSLSFFLSF